MAKRFKNFRLKADLDSDKIEKEDLDSDKIENGDLDLDKIKNKDLDWDKIKKGDLDSEKIEIGDLDSDKIKNGDLDSEKNENGELEFLNSEAFEKAVEKKTFEELTSINKNKDFNADSLIGTIIEEENRIELPVPDSNFEEILIVKELQKVYNKGKENEVYALKGISFSIRKGEMVSIMGPSGSGKSTLLHLLGALDSPTAGEIFIGNRSISKMSESELTKFRRMQVGFVFQYYNLIPTLSALENVELPMVLAGVPKKQRLEQAKYMLELVGLKDRMKNKPNQMSGGQMQRVAIARALANHPSIVLADEPTGNLDTKTGEEIMNLFKKLNEEYNQTFIIVTHDPKIASYTKKTFHILDGLLDRIEEREP